MKSVAGFTLVELMITLAVLAIIASIAMPSFRDTLDRNRTTVAANGFVGLLSYARSEALRRGVPVQVCPTDDTADQGINCSNGWDAAFWVATAGDEVLRRQDGPRGGLQMTGPATVSFLANGLLTGGQNDQIFTVSVPGGTASAERCVRLRVTGAAQVRDC